MHKRLVAAGLLLLGCCGCSGMSHTDKGLLAGGALGAGTGALVGNALGNTGAGALVGGAVGAIAGGVAGSAADKEKARADRAETRAAVATAAAAAPPVGLHDIASMTQNNVSDTVIINRIRTSGSVYNLNSQDLIWLKQQGVSDAVVTEMQARSARQVYVAPPPPTYVRHVYVVDPPPPPPPAVHFGVGFSNGRRW